MVNFSSISSTRIKSLHNQERSMIILTNYTKKHIQNNITEHYDERFFRRIVWVKITNQNFYRLFTADTLLQTMKIP